MKKILALCALCLTLPGCVVYAPPATISASVVIPAPVIYPQTITPPVYHRPLFLPPLPPPSYYHRPHHYRHRHHR